MTLLSDTLSIAPGGEFRTIAAGAEPITGVLGRIDPTILVCGSTEPHIRKMRHMQAVQTSGRKTEKSIDLPARLLRASGKLFDNSSETSLARRSARTVSVRSAAHALRRAKRDYGKMPSTTLVLDVRYGPDGRVESVADASGSSLGLNYNLELAPGKFLEVMDTATSRTDLVRDGRGNLIRQVQWLEDPSAPGSYSYLVTAYEFDARDNRTAESVPFAVADESARFDAAPPVWATRSTFDAAGNELTTTDALGNVTRRTFDSFGNVLTVTDPLGNRTTNAYDAHGNLTRTTDASGNFTTFSYSANGLLNSVRDGAGHVAVSFSYNAKGEITSTLPAVGCDAAATPAPPSLKYHERWGTYPPVISPEFGLSPSDGFG